MREVDINALLQKAEELKALFVLGQRVIPFIEEIFLFIKETSPLLDEISVSIHENIQRMPKAAKQLSKVTEATETATNEIMDTVDGLVYKSGIISNNLAQIKSLANGDESLTAEQFMRIVNNSEELLKSIKRDSQGIMMALQVQDITSQQIAAVTSILDAVQSRLGKLTKRLEILELADIVAVSGADTKQSRSYDSGSSVATLHRPIAFDPDAVESLSGGTARQAEVDALFSGEIPIPNSSEEASADDNAVVFEAQHPATQPDFVQQAEDPDKQSAQPQSQDDIDAMFGAAGIDDDSPVSQDVIVAMFN